MDYSFSMRFCQSVISAWIGEYKQWTIGSLRFLCSLSLEHNNCLASLGSRIILLYYWNAIINPIFFDFYNFCPGQYRSGCSCSSKSRVLMANQIIVRVGAYVGSPTDTLLLILVYPNRCFAVLLNLLETLIQRSEDRCHFYFLTLSSLILKVSSVSA